MYAKFENYVHKNMHVNVCSCFIHNYPKLEATTMFFDMWMEKHTVVHPYSGILSSNKKKCAVKPWKDMDET